MLCAEHTVFLSLSMISEELRVGVCLIFLLHFQPTLE